QFLMLMGASAKESLEFLTGQIAAFEAAGVGAVAIEFRADAVRAAVLAGRLARAMALADELGELPASPRARHQAEVCRGLALTYSGEFDRAAAVLDATLAVAASDYSGRGEALSAKSELALWSGRPEAAEQLAKEV